MFKWFILIIVLNSYLNCKCTNFKCSLCVEGLCTKCPDQNYMKVNSDNFCQYNLEKNCKIYSKINGCFWCDGYTSNLNTDNSNLIRTCIDRIDNLSYCFQSKNKVCESCIHPYYLDSSNICRLLTLNINNCRVVGKNKKCLICSNQLIANKNSGKCENPKYAKCEKKWAGDANLEWLKDNSTNNNLNSYPRCSKCPDGFVINTKEYNFIDANNNKINEQDCIEFQMNSQILYISVLTLFLLF